MLCHALAHSCKRSDKKTKNKKQFKVLEKGKYITPNQIFEGFVGITDDLTMNDDKYLQITECSKM